MLKNINIGIVANSWHDIHVMLSKMKAGGKEIRLSAILRGRAAYLPLKYS